MARPITIVRWEALQEIEQAATQARVLHLTSLPGQDLVYAAKLDQARAYISAEAADSGAAVPPYVAADVAVVGGTALAAAQAIVGAAEAFHASAGPQIEQARRAGKLAVQAAETPEAVETAKTAALLALQSI